MKNFYFLFVLILPITLQSQTRNLDSLNAALSNSKHDTTKARIYVELSSELYNTHPDTMIPLCQKALKIIDKLNPSISNMPTVKGIKGRATYNIGIIHYNKSNFSKAKEYLEESAKISEQAGDKVRTALSLSSLGFISHNKGDLPQTIDYYTRSLNIMKEINKIQGVALCLNNLGATQLELGNISKALDYYNSSLKLLEQTSGQLLIASALNNIGTIYSNQGDNIKAHEYYMKSLIIYKKIGDKKLIATGLSNIGSIYKDQGDNLRALDYSAQSLKIREEIGDKQGIAEGLNSTGLIYENQGDFIKALNYYNQSLKIREELGNKKGIAITLGNIGGIYFREHEFQKALLYFKRSLKIKEEIGYKIGLASSLVNIGKVSLKEKQYSESKALGLRTMRIAQELGFTEQLKKASTLLYQTYLKTNQSDSAYFYLSLLTNLLKRSLKNNYFTLSEKEKELFFSTMEKDFMLYFDFTLKYSEEMPFLADTAYNISLTNKGLSLKSSTAMRCAIFNSGDTSLIKEFEAWVFLKKTISNLDGSGKDFKKLEAQANDMEKELVKKSNNFNDFEKVQNLDWKTVKKGLKKDEAAFEFIHFKSEIDTLYSTKYVALLIKANSLHPELIELFNETELIKILGSKNETNDSYVTHIYGKRNTENIKLYNLIWKPMEKSLKGVKTIYYSPSGLLHKISFAALSKSKDVFLCDNHRLELQGSTGKLAMPEKFEFTNESTVGIYGDINYDTPETLKDSTALLSWPYLEGTKTESEKVAAILKSNNFKYNYVAGKNATETEFKNQAPQNNVVHIATHGFFFPEPDAYTYAEKQDSTNKETQMYRSGERAVGVYNFIINKNPLMRSGLVFASANEVWSRKEYLDKEDGVLTAQEVATLDLRKTNLVVLSACETGLGDVKGTEGVYGLQRSLKMAGVKFIIMSLWQVPDAETVEFMEKFYTKLTKTKDIKTSFYETRNEMRKKYDPFYWAAFVLLE